MHNQIQEYMTPNGFDLPKLIHNDYFNAIKLLFNQKYYVSCMKLLASFIDTVAFLEYGDMKGNFIKWLDSFATLHKIGISSSQLWELRNSILHMSNLDSRKVIAGKEKRISFCVAKEGFRIPENQGVEYFNLKDLIGTIADALSVWIKTFNKNPDKFVNFIERYDTIISDDRHSVLQI